MPSISFDRLNNLHRPTQRIGPAPHRISAFNDLHIPPRADAVLSETAATAPTPRDRHIRAIAENGQITWQRDSGYNQRARIEGHIGRFKQVIGPMVRFQTAKAQATEIAIAVEVLNRMLGPDSVRLA